MTDLGDTQALGSRPGPGDVPGLPAPERIGPYRLLRLIGEGGMGEVWLAEQFEPRRRVAIKVIKFGMDTKQVVARFESERQALAVMDHPAIAKVFDGGSTPEGRPYFVMEYVAGVPIDEHCDTHKLSTAARLDLFTEVCEGVKHAHQKAIIHRDLKPSNILVSLVDGKPQPKIIDFGIAKATGYRLTEKTLFTEVGAVIGTPEYMSPEQADLTGQDVDTRTDVYSLGVILYQLLTGELPLGSRELRASSCEELRRRLKDTEPPRPSTRLSTLGDRATDAARNRSTDRETLGRQLAGDLDAITMTALEKERDRRYGTPSELAADIARHIRNEPVLARAPSTTYRVRKYIKRHRVGVGVALGLVTLLMVFAATMTVQAGRIAAQRDRANREAAAAKQVSDFLVRMFNVSDPSEARGNSITAREILDRAAKDVETGPGRDPELQARMMLAIGRVYLKLGLLGRADSLLQSALDLQRATLGPDHADTLRAESQLGFIYFQQGRYQKAERLLAETLERQRRVFGVENEVTLDTMNSLAVAEWSQGRLPEAERLHRQVLSIRRRLLGVDHRETLGSANNLANVYLRMNRLPEAEALLRTTLESKRRVLGPDHPSALGSASNLGLLLQQQNHLAESEALLRQTLEAQRRVLGPEHPDVLETSGNLGVVLTQTGRVAEGEQILRETVEIERRALGREHPSSVDGMVKLGGSYVRHGQLAEGERLLRETLEVQSKLPELNTPDRAWTLAELGLVALQRAEPVRALEVLEEALAHGLTPDSVSAIAADPSWASLRDNPRFARLIAGPPSQRLDVVPSPSRTAR